jgi:hypothetical protein
MTNQIEKEIRKHLYYSLSSERVMQEKPFRIFNFYLVCCGGDDKTKSSMSSIYEALEERMRYGRKNNLIFLEYELKNKRLAIYQA